jgi:starvation-inducible DNA-binding protein
VIERLDKLDLVSQDMIIQHTGQLEQFQWFVRAHLENAAGDLATSGAHTEREAAQSARKEAAK